MDDTTRLEEMLELRDDLVIKLAGHSRRERQEASHELAALAHEDATVVAEVTEELVEALSVPEAQTRWECLDALTVVAPINPKGVAAAFDGAETALFEEGPATMRLAAFRFLARFGSLSPQNSDESWPIMEEAVQCYHGDSEYREMLVCLRDFARGDISDEVNSSLIARMSFDAKSGRGLIKRYSAEITSILKGA